MDTISGWFKWNCCQAHEDPKLHYSPGSSDESDDNSRAQHPYGSGQNSSHAAPRKRGKRPRKVKNQKHRRHDRSRDKSSQRPHRRHRSENEDESQSHVDQSFSKQDCAIPRSPNNEESQDESHPDQISSRIESNSKSKKHQQTDIKKELDKALLAQIRNNGSQDSYKKAKKQPSNNGDASKNPSSAEESPSVKIPGFAMIKNDRSHGEVQEEEDEDKAQHEPNVDPNEIVLPKSNGQSRQADIIRNSSTDVKRNDPYTQQPISYGKTSAQNTQGGPSNGPLSGQTSQIGNSSNNWNPSNGDVGGPQNHLQNFQSQLLRQFPNLDQSNNPLQMQGLIGGQPDPTKPLNPLAGSLVGGINEKNMGSTGEQPVRLPSLLHQKNGDFSKLQLGQSRNGIGLQSLDKPSLDSFGMDSSFEDPQNIVASVNQIEVVLNFLQQTSNSQANGNTIFNSQIYSFVEQQFQQLAELTQTHFLQQMKNQFNPNQGNQPGFPQASNGSEPNFKMFYLVIQKMQALQSTFFQMQQQNGVPSSMANLGEDLDQINGMSMMNGFKDQFVMDPQQHMDKNMMKQIELWKKHEKAKVKIGFMSKNNIKDLHMDAKSILQRAPKLVITNIDIVQQILPKDKIFINAFGVIENVADFNYIPLDVQQQLDQLHSNMTIFQQISKYQPENKEGKALEMMQKQIYEQQEELQNFSSYFGSKKHMKEISTPSNRKSNSRTTKNDIVLKNDETIGRSHFRIRYCPLKNKFLLKDMGDGSGTFIRIEEPTILSSGTVICIGESHIIVGLIFDNLLQNKDMKQNQQSVSMPYLVSQTHTNEVIATQLMLRFIRGPKTSESMKFMPEDAPILIGRNFDCHIQVASDESISRYQARIDHIDDKWILKDGNGESSTTAHNSDPERYFEENNQADMSPTNGRAGSQPDSGKPRKSGASIERSTNGTWIFCNKEEELSGRQILKVGNSFLQTRVLQTTSGRHGQIEM